jgi:hypothetical protein
MPPAQRSFGFRSLLLIAGLVASLAACTSSGGAGDDDGDDDGPAPTPEVSCESDGPSSCICGTPDVFQDQVAVCNLDSVAPAGGASQCCNSSIDCSCEGYGCYLTGSIYCACGETKIVGTSGSDVQVSDCTKDLIGTSEVHCCNDDILGSCRCSSSTCSGGDAEVPSCSTFDVMHCKDWQDPVASCK